MLSEFLSLNTDVIVARARERVSRRAGPSLPAADIDDGVPLFVRQLAETLKHKAAAGSSTAVATECAAARHGAAVLAAGFGVSQVVRDYGDICQAVTEVASEHDCAITAAEFQVLNECLDDAIAEGVTEHARLTAQQRSDEEIERLGQVAHELRDALNGAVLAFHALKYGPVAINGTTAGILGRSLTDLQNLIDRAVSHVRLTSGGQRSVTLSVSRLFDEISAVAMLHSEYRSVHFSAGPVDASLTLEGDPQLLASAIMNLVHNAFKHTPAGGTVQLRARAENGRLLISVADECGGLPEVNSDLFKPFANRRGRDRSGLGLGLSIARRAVQSHHGEISITNMPGIGCIFTIDLPLAAQLPVEMRS